MKKRLIAFMTLILLFVLTALSGCQKTETGAYKVYYIDTDKTSLVPISFDYASTELDDMLEEAFSRLCANPDNVDYMRTIPSGVAVEDYEIDEGALSIFFSREYMEIDNFTEILIRAAIVKTMVQIEGIDSVTFYVDNSPLENANDQAIGAMTAESFIEDFGEETDSLLYASLTLYFASADGVSLVPEERNIYYSRNVAVEKLIIDQLLKGPKESYALRSIATDTKVISVTVTDGVCYVNFDSTFENSITGVTENATLYSIVNSLTELYSINEVQILVNGETPKLANVQVDLAGSIQRNEDIILENYGTDLEDMYNPQDDINMDINPEEFPEMSDEWEYDIMPDMGEQETISGD